MEVIGFFSIVFSTSSSEQPQQQQQQQQTQARQCNTTLHSSPYHEPAVILSISCPVPVPQATLFLSFSGPSRLFCLLRKVDRPSRTINSNAVPFQCRLPSSFARHPQHLDASNMAMALLSYSSRISYLWIAPACRLNAKRRQ